ncbi:hypothetical protein E1B28_009572 [Marasmius oreades]|uniref:Uncharacterized protein n=1 Tax=Marasmius oreades TaxID=181124 RepID=A0A9P7RWH3_9AGAR|nr:uncharacterized protein E1B28_009572 [Marasmius oreades]KAG7090456.1 hypothetical protein E1B28_009572 [Marasmius oreades]
MRLSHYNPTITGLCDIYCNDSPPCNTYTTQGVASGDFFFFYKLESSSERGLSPATRPPTFSPIDRDKCSKYFHRRSMDTTQILGNMDLSTDDPEDLAWMDLWRRTRRGGALLTLIQRSKNINLPSRYSPRIRSHDSQLTAYNEADVSLAKYEDDPRLESTIHSTPFESQSTETKFSYRFDDASEEVSLLLPNPHNPDGASEERSSFYPESPLSSQRRIPQDLPSLDIPSPKSKQITVVSPSPTPSSPPSAYSQTSATTQLQRTLTGLGGRMSPPPVPPLPLLPASPTSPSPLSVHLSPLPERGAELSQNWIFTECPPRYSSGAGHVCV